jgi:hypothetical protein
MFFSEVEKFMWNLKGPEIDLKNNKGVGFTVPDIKHILMWQLTKQCGIKLQNGESTFSSTDGVKTGIIHRKDCRCNHILIPYMKIKMN